MTSPAASHMDPVLFAADPRMLAYARTIAATFARAAPHLADEFESAAMLGLVEAARSFDPSLGASFKTHATHRIAGACRDAARAWQPKGFRRRGDAPGVSDYEWSRLFAFAPDEPEAVEAPGRLLRALSPRERAVVAAYFFAPFDRTLTKSEATHLHNARGKLREMGRERVAELLGVSR